MKTKTEPLVLCELCHSFACEPGMKFTMDLHRQQCDGKVKELVVRKEEER